MLVKHIKQDGMDEHTDKMPENGPIKIFYKKKKLKKLKKKKVKVWFHSLLEAGHLGLV